MSASKALILASKSPRRRELFALITPDFSCVSPDVDESAIQAPNAPALCRALARAKCRAVCADFPQDTVIGCDTVVEIDGMILGKPHTADEARIMLRRLSGHRHRVYTGVCIRTAGTERCFSCRTSVDFYTISDFDIESYIASDEPYDKAGGYGVQGAAAKFVRGIWGDYYNVMGFPLSRVYNALRDLNALPDRY